MLYFTRYRLLALDNNTLVIFTSDNGPTFNGGSDSAFFESAKPLRGLKGSVYEGGIRVPYIARWPGRIKAAGTNKHISAFWDFLPTCCELVGKEPPQNIDGVSMLPTLLGRHQQQKKHEYLYWELNGQQAIRMDKWKALRLKPGRNIEFYDLDNDIAESKDLADDHPEIVTQMAEIFRTGRTESEVFPLLKAKS